MVTKLKERQRAEGLRLYLENIPIGEIARRLNKRRETISVWKSKYKWDDEVEEFKKEEIRKKALENKDEAKDRLLKISRAIQAKFAQEINDKDIKPQDAIKAMEFEMKLRGLSTINIQGEIGLTHDKIIRIAQECGDLNE